MKIEKRLELDAPIERVWSAISDPAELSQWFPDQAEYELTAGAGGTFAWLDESRLDEKAVYPMRVELVEPPTHLVWSWTIEPGASYDAHRAARVEWTLTPTASGGTVLEMVESGLSAKDAKLNDPGWDAEFAELRDYLSAVPAAGS